MKLILSAIVFLTLCLPSPLRAKSYPRGDGTLRLYNYYLKENIEIQFRKKGRLDSKEIARAEHFFRSRDNEESIPIDTRLLDLLDHLQDYYQVDTIEIISGYRRPAFNQQLLNNGRKVSPRSLHMKGKAVDFHIDEIKEETIRDYLTGLKLGGVGYYGPLDFIHIDTGPVKSWGGSEKFARKLIGILAQGAPIQLTSDKNDYLPGDSLFFQWTFAKGYGPKKVQAVRLEHFWRGEWVPCPSREIPERNSLLPIADLNCPVGYDDSQFGKYRWIFKIKGQDELLSSNEFYLKKQ